MIIDGSNLILGRLATTAAKKALEGEQIVIINCEKIIITGRKKFLLHKFQERQDRGNPYYGPYFPKMPDRIVRRVIRGMLPYKKLRGKDAYKKIKCFIGVPEKYKTQKFETLEKANYSKLKTLNFLSIADYSKMYGKQF